MIFIVTFSFVLVKSLFAYFVVSPVSFTDACYCYLTSHQISTPQTQSRVKCSVCNNSWYQSRDRLHNIPTSGYEMLPSSKSDLDRIARNLAADHAPDFHGVNKLYVGNLDFDTTQDDLLNFFEDGEGMKVCDVSLVTGPDG